MPETSSLPSSTTEDVRRLAEFVGYDNISSECADADSDGWNPFTDPRADLQVLERVREVWGTADIERGMAANTPWTRFKMYLPSASEYTVGTYARAALVVLREMEEG